MRPVPDQALRGSRVFARERGNLWDMRSIIVLGSTGSVGTQALDVARRNPDRFRVVGLSAGSNHELLVGQIREFLPPAVAIADENSAADVRERLAGLRDIEVIAGPDAAERLARDAEADMVLNALVGSAGLGPTLAALQSGKMLALANKESLVVGGELVKDLIKGEPERLVPVDSEHAALALCLRGERRDDIVLREHVRCLQEELGLAFGPELLPYGHSRVSAQHRS